MHWGEQVRVGVLVNDVVAASDCGKCLKDDAGLPDPVPSAAFQLDELFVVLLEGAVAPVSAPLAAHPSLKPSLPPSLLPSL